MPILWRYLLLGFLPVFSLSVFSFLSILLVSRFKEIARFGALSASLGKTLLFVAYQIPLIIPIAIPISALIASLLLFQKMSKKSFELTAFRASGISLHAILTPILLMSLLLSLVNFTFSADIAPFCRRSSKELLYYETSTNPLLLLQRPNLVKMKKSYLQMKIEEEGVVAKDLILITHNQSNNRLSLVSARKLRMESEELRGKDIAIITHLQSDTEQMFDPLILENQSRMSTNASALSSSLKKNRPRLDPSALEFPMLRLRAQETGKIGKKAILEMGRRITLSLAVFSFTLLGCAFGIEPGRAPSRKNLFQALGLTMILMLSYLLGKECKGAPWIALAIFALPHPLIWCASILKIKRIGQGRS